MKTFRMEAAVMSASSDGTAEPEESKQARLLPNFKISSEMRSQLPRLRIRASDYDRGDDAFDRCQAEMMSFLLKNALQGPRHAAP